MLPLSILTTYFLSSSSLNSFQLSGLHILPQVSHIHNSVEVSDLAYQAEEGPIGQPTLKMPQKVILNITLYTFS